MIITHRLSSIRDVDLIAVMDAGEIVEGPATHKQLMDMHGAYWSLVTAQNSEDFKRP